MSFECKMLTSLVTGPRQTVVIGRVVCAHIEDRFVQDKERCHIDTPALQLIGRMHGSGWYARCPTCSRWTGRPGPSGSSDAARQPGEVS